MFLPLSHCQVDYWLYQFTDFPPIVSVVPMRLVSLLSIRSRSKIVRWVLSYTKSSILNKDLQRKIIKVWCQLVLIYFNVFRFETYSPPSLCVYTIGVLPLPTPLISYTTRSTTDVRQTTRSDKLRKFENKRVHPLLPILLWIFHLSNTPI